MRICLILLEPNIDDNGDYDDNDGYAGTMVMMMTVQVMMMTMMIRMMMMMMMAWI